MAIRRIKAEADATAHAEVSRDIFIHPLAVVEENVHIGAGTRIWRFAHVRTGAVIGDECMLGNHVFVDAGVRIGHRVKIQNGVLVYAGVSIDDEVFLGPHMTFTNDLYPRAGNPDWQVTPTHVCRGASVGANATIVCGVTIGAYAMIAAGSVVTRAVAPYALVRGNPARCTGYVCVCGHKLCDLPVPDPAVLHCRTCGRDLTLERPSEPAV